MKKKHHILHLGINMTLDEVLNEAIDVDNLIFEKSYKKSMSEKSKSNKKNKISKYGFDSPKFKLGRERLITGTINKLNKIGISVSRGTVRSYLYKKYNQWLSGDKGADWIVKAGKKAKTLGFDIDQFKDGSNEGKDRGSKEGRAYFFTCLFNGFVKHFEKNEK